MIKGLKPRLAEGGKIKIGKLGEERESEGGKKYRLPQKLDHFVITTMARDENGDLINDNELMDALRMDLDTGEIDQEPLRAIPIMLHSDDIDEVFPTSYALYRGKKRLCFGNGETGQRYGMDNKGNLSPEPIKISCPCELLEKTKQCKAHGTLHCSILAPNHAVAGCVHRWRTTSVISIQRMWGSLLHIKQTFGVLRGLPLELRLNKEIVTPGGGKPRAVYVCHIALKATDIMAVQERALRMAEARRELAGNAPTDAHYLALLQAPADEGEDLEEQSTTSQEYHPEEPHVELDSDPYDFGPDTWPGSNDSAADEAERSQ